MFDVVKDSKVLFITNYRFVSSKTKNGGVKLCTMDYLALLKTKYNVILFEVDFTGNFFSKLKFKLGIDVYDYYDVEQYKNQLSEVIKANNIEKVFINHTSAMKFAKTCKTFNPSIQTVILSHGNESGDYIHELVNHNKTKLHQFYKLGRQLYLESWYRKNYIDRVFVVSQIEQSIEKWLRCNDSVFVHRIFKKEFLEWKPIKGRVGFLSDLTHEPNIFGLEQLCEVLSKKQIPKDFKLRIIGLSDSRLNPLLAKYKFIDYLGYLDEVALKAELKTWMVYLNIVLYYSKGVSTKLAKGMNYGLPILTTVEGNRGYKLHGLEDVTVTNIDDFVLKMLELSNDKLKAEKVENIVKDNVCKMKDFSSLTDKI